MRKRHYYDGAAGVGFNCCLSSELTRPFTHPGDAHAEPAQATEARAALLLRLQILAATVSLSDMRIAARRLPECL